MCKPVMQVVLHVTNTLLVVKEMQVHARQEMHIVLFFSCHEGPPLAGKRLV